MRDGGDIGVGIQQDGWRKRGGYCSTLKQLGKDPSAHSVSIMGLDYDQPILIMLGYYVV